VSSKCAVEGTPTSVARRLPWYGWPARVVISLSEYAISCRDSSISKLARRFVKKMKSSLLVVESRRMVCIPCAAVTTRSGHGRTYAQLVRRAHNDNIRRQRPAINVPRPRQAATELSADLELASFQLPADMCCDEINGDTVGGARDNLCPMSLRQRIFPRQTISACFAVGCTKSSYEGLLPLESGCCGPEVRRTRIAGTGPGCL
jgi:hypothetical protein